MASVTSSEHVAGIAEDRPRRVRRLRRPSWEAIALGAFSVVVFALLAHYSLRLWTHSYDEDIYRSAGVYTWQHLPGSLWNMDASDRGLQRIGSWVLGLGIVALDGPSGYRLARLLDVAFYCSTVVPIFLWTRALGTPRRWAAGAATLSILVPWATVTATFMTENVAYALAMWAFFAIWRAAVRPGWASIAVALVAIGIACLARSVMMLLSIVLVVAIVGVAVRCHGRAAWARRREWTPLQILPWAALLAVSVAAACLYAFDREAFIPLAQGYRTEIGFHWSGLGRLARIALAKVTSGVGILPAIVALAFVIKSFWRPARPESFGLALMAVLTWGFITYSSMRAGYDERYLMYLGPVMFVSAAVALGRREVGPIMVAVATIGVVVLFAFQPWRTSWGNYGFLVAPAEAFHGRVLLLGIGSRSPGVGLSYSAILAIGILIVGGLASLALWKRGLRWSTYLGLALLAGVGLTQLAQTTYNMQHFTAESNYGPPKLEDKAWVSRAMDNRKGVGFWVSRAGADFDPVETWRETAFWNMSISTMFIYEHSLPTAAYGRATSRLTVDTETGHVTGRQYPIPRYMLEWTLTQHQPLVGTQIATAPQSYEPFRLLRLDGTPRLRWLVTGNDDSGWTVPAATTTVRVFRDTPGGPCLNVTLLGPNVPTSTRPRVTIGNQTITVPPKQQRTVGGIPLRGGTSGHYADIPVRVEGQTKFPGGQVRGVRIDLIKRAACA